MSSPILVPGRQSAGHYHACGQGSGLTKFDKSYVAVVILLLLVKNVGGVK